MYKNISVKEINKVRVIELNRPKSLNALSKNLLRELAESKVDAFLLDCDFLSLESLE